MTWHAQVTWDSGCLGLLHLCISLQAFTKSLFDIDYRVLHHRQL